MAVEAVLLPLCGLAVLHVDDALVTVRLEQLVRVTVCYVTLSNICILRTNMDPMSAGSSASQ